VSKVFIDIPFSNKKTKNFKNKQTATTVIYLFIKT